MEKSNNTLLIVIIILLVGFGVWYVAGYERNRDDASIEVNLPLNDDSGRDGGGGLFDDNGGNRR